MAIENYTPKQIEEILQAFFEVAGTRQYIGARYVPIFGRGRGTPIEWDNSDAYEPLSIVYYEGDTYTSRRYVPAGIAIDNQDYWVITGRYNAQVEQYRQEVLEFADDIAQVQANVDSLGTWVDSDFVPFPDSTVLPKYGTVGQVLSTLANGKTEWVNPVVPSDAQTEAAVNAWLEDHPEATTTVTDGSITTAKLADGAVTDAKLAASGIKKKVGELDYMFRPFNAYSVPYKAEADTAIFTRTGERTYHVVYNGTAQKSFNLYDYINDIPFNSGEVLCFKCDTPVSNECYAQIYIKQVNGTLHWLTDVKDTYYYTIPNNLEQLLYRLIIPAAANPYSLDVYVSVEIIANPGTMFSTHPNEPLTETDLNNVRDSGVYLLASDYTYTNKPAEFTANTGYLEVFHSGTTVCQILHAFSSAMTYIRRGWYDGSSFNTWFRIDTPDVDKLFYIKSWLANNTDLNTVTETGYYGLNNNSGYTNMPPGFGNGAAYLIVYNISGWVIQLFVAHSTGLMFKRRGDASNHTFESWYSIANQNTYNNTYEINEYSQTLNVTATPTITSDNNDYLASTGDTTDRTNDILTMLQSTGICRLGPGVFHVNNLQMPVGSSLIGSGFATILRLSGTSDGFAAKLNTNCLISDMQILGADSNPASGFTSTVGGRHGILWQGTYHTDNNSPSRAMVNNVWIRYFTGGGITLYDTGYTSINCIEVSNAFIYECCAGINISYFSEFSKFTNVRSSGCYYGCINNGGNNIFVNCDFSSNMEYAFVIDNSSGQSPNNSHGSCVGCVINHTAHGGVANTGTGILILNADNGFMFDGCQIFFSKIDIQDSDGVVVSNSNFGYDNCDISVNGGGAILFSGNMHQGASAVSVLNNSHVVFANCYVRSTGEAFGA